jgi:hypothetical protein
MTKCTLCAYQKGRRVWQLVCPGNYGEVANQFTKWHRGIIGLVLLPPYHDASFRINFLPSDIDIEHFLAVSITGWS